MKEKTTRGKDPKTPLAVKLKVDAAYFKLSPRSGLISLLLRQTPTSTKTTYTPQKKLKREEKRRADSLRPRVRGNTTA